MRMYITAKIIWPLILQHWQQIKKNGICLYMIMKEDRYQPAAERISKDAVNAGGNTSGI